MMLMSLWSIAFTSCGRNCMLASSWPTISLSLRSTLSDMCCKLSSRVKIGSMSKVFLYLIADFAKSLSLGTILIRLAIEKNGLVVIVDCCKGLLQVPGRQFPVHCRRIGFRHHRQVVFSDFQSAFSNRRFLRHV